MNEYQIREKHGYPVEEKAGGKLMAVTLIILLALGALVGLNIYMITL